MTVLLIGVTCVVMNLLLCSSGVYYMDTIADTLQGGDTVMMNSEGAESFNPQLVTPDEDLTIVVNGAQGRFRMTNWYITAVVTLLSGVLAYFVSGRALKPLRPIDDDGQLLVGRYELRVKARRSAIIQDHRAAAL